MLQAITRLAIAAPRRIIAVALFVVLGAAVFGIPVINSLSPGGFQDPTSESARATELLREKFGQTDQKMMIVVTAPAGARSEQARRAATDIVNQLKRSPWVTNVSSAWTSPSQAAAPLVSKDNKSGLIVANLKGGENDAQKYAKTLSAELVHDRDGVTVRAGGMAMAYAEVNQQNQHDLLLMESIAIPLSFVVLVWVFGGLVAAALPIVLGGLAIVGTMSVLRLISFTTEVSTYALDLSIAMGLALAIDYTLLIISRYREELVRCNDRERALFRTMATAGRTVLFSATTVALSMAVLLVFPMYFLKSSGYTVLATAVIVAFASAVLTPALIVLLGPRLDALNVRPLAARLLTRWKWSPDDARKPVKSTLFWYRSTRFVLGHAVPAGLTVVTMLLLLGAPFLNVRWGFPDERVLPRSAPARQVADMLDNDFTNDLGTAVSVVIPETRGMTHSDLEQYAAELSRVPDVSAVTAPTGTFVAGHRAGPPIAPTGIAHGSALLTVASTAPLYSHASDAQLDRLHEVAARGRSVQMTGLAQINRDSVEAINKHLPTVLGLIALITFTLLFLLTGSVVIPLQALVCNVLSLTAAFGAMVWIFQDGHLGALGTTPNGTLNANVPMLLFCIAFGLSMDYEVFLVSRIREYWVASGAHKSQPGSPEAREANDEATALGLAGIGRVVTAAALVMSISFAALIPAQVSFMRMLGLGLTLAVLVDATLVRMVLVPAFVHLVGPWSWWAPKPLAWLHQHLWTGEGAVARVARRRWAAEASHPTAGLDQESTVFVTDGG